MRPGGARDGVVGMDDSGTIQINEAEGTLKKGNANGCVDCSRAWCLSIPSFPCPCIAHNGQRSSILRLGIYISGYFLPTST